MKFKWTMTENDWKRYRKTIKSKAYDPNNVYGNCIIGGICCDFLHTMDDDDWYAYTNVFYVTEASSYGKLEDGTPYELAIGSPRVPLKCKSFESFKKTFEKLFEKYINDNPEFANLLDKDITWK